MQSADRQQSSELLEDDYTTTENQKKSNSKDQMHSNEESQKKALGDAKSPMRDDQPMNDYTDYRQQLRRFNDGLAQSEQRQRTKDGDLSSTAKQLMSVDRRNMRRDEASQIIEESRKYLQERRSKRRSQTDDVQEHSSAQEESELDPPSQIMNTFDKRQTVEGLVDQYDPIKDEQSMLQQKRTIQPKRQHGGLDLEGLEDALNADLGEGSSSIDGAIGDQPINVSDGRAAASELPSIDEKAYGARGTMNFGTDASYIHEENELLIRDEAEQDLDSSASASLSQRALDRMIFQDGGQKDRTGKRNRGGRLNEEIQSTDRVARRTEESMQQSVSGSANNIFGRAVPENIHDDFSSLNTHLQNEENERQLQKYEADIRQHISIEQQLQIYIDSLKQKIEDMENDQIKMQEQNSKLMAENQELERSKASEIEQLKSHNKLEIQKQTDQISSLQKENQQQKQIIEQKDNEINDLKSTNHKNEERLKRTQTQLKQLQTEKEKLGTENTHLKTEKNKLKQEVLKNQEAIISLKKNLESSHRRKLSMQSQPATNKDQQQQQSIQQTTMQPNINSVRIQQRQMPISKKDQLVAQKIRDLEVSGKKVVSINQMDIDKQLYPKNGMNDNRQLEQVVARQAAIFASQTGSPFPLGSDSEVKARLAPKSQRASKSTKNLFLQDAQALRLSNQKSARNVSADRINMIDSMTIEGQQQQLLINQSQLMGLGGRSQPQLIIHDALQLDNHRASNQSLKKRIPLKKAGGPGAVGTAKAHNHSLLDVSQSGPGSRKQSTKRAGDHFVGGYVMPNGLNPKQSIESTFSYNVNKPNLQKYLKQNRNMMMSRDPKKRVQSVTVVPTRNTTLQKADKPQRSNINQRASSINSSLAAQGAALRSFQPLRVNESIQKQRKKGVQSSQSKSPDFGNMMRHDGQHAWIPTEGPSVAQNSHHFINLQELTQQRANNSTRQVPVAHRSSVGSSMHAQSPSKDAQNIKATAVNLVPEEALVLSNRNGGVDSRGSYSGQHLLYTGGGTGEPISSFQQQQLLSGNNSIHQTRGNQGDGTTSQGQDVVVSVDLQKSKQSSVSYKPQVPSQQNLNQFIQMNLMQLQKSGINLGQHGFLQKDDQAKGSKMGSDQVQTRAQSSQNSQPRAKNRTSDPQKNKQPGNSNEAQNKSKSSMAINRQVNHGVQSSARNEKRSKNASNSINSHSKLNQNTRSIQNLKTISTISREGAISSLGPQKNAGLISQANLNVQPSMKISASQIQLHGDQRLGARVASNMSQASDVAQNRQHTMTDMGIINQHLWEEHQLIHPEGVEFNGPGTRLEFLDVDGSSDTQEHFLNRPLSQIDIRDVAQGLIEADSGQNATTAGGYHPKGQKAIQSMPNTNNQSRLGQRGMGKIKHSHRASQDAQNTANRRTQAKQSYNHSITSVQSLVGSQSMQQFKQPSTNSNNMVLVDSKNIPYGEIITVPASQAKDIVSVAGADSRNKSNWQQLKQVGPRGTGNSKSVIQTKTGNSGGKSLVNRNLNAKPTMESQSRTKNLVQNFVSKTYGQTAQGAQAQRKQGANRAMPSGMGSKQKNQVPALVRSLHIDLTSIEDKTLTSQQQQQQKGN